MTPAEAITFVEDRLADPEISPTVRAFLEFAKVELEAGRVKNPEQVQAGFEFLNMPLPQP